MEMSAVETIESVRNEIIEMLARIDNIQLLLVIRNYVEAVVG